MAKSSKLQTRGSARPKLTDIARLCGVSAATVSRVLNGDENFSARPEVRQRIIDAAKSIGYAPDLAARNLNRGSTHLIGVFGSPYTHVGEGINDQIFEGIAEAVRSRDYDAFFELAAREPVERGLPFWRFDGAILIQSPQREIVDDLDARRVPYVSVNEIVGTPVASVLADDVLGARLAMEHLAGLGHQRIAYANALSSYFAHYSIGDRLATIEEYAKRHDISLVPGYDQNFVAPEAFLRHAVQEHGATAVLCYDHRIAVAILGAAYRFGLKIPDDFSLMCFNDEFPVATIFPPLTVVSVSGREMGSTAARMLLQAMKHGPSDQTTRVNIPERLVIRASTAPPPKR